MVMSVFNLSNDLLKLMNYRNRRLQRWKSEFSYGMIMEKTNKLCCSPLLLWHMLIFCPNFKLYVSIINLLLLAVVQSNLVDVCNSNVLLLINLGLQTIVCVQINWDFNSINFFHIYRLWIRCIVFTGNQFSKDWKIG